MIYALGTKVLVGPFETTLEAARFSKKWWGRVAVFFDRGPAEIDLPIISESDWEISVFQEAFQ